MNTFERLVDLINTRFEVAKENIKPETNLREDLEIDSLDFVEFIMDAEEVFEASFPDEAMDSLITVQDVVNHIDSQRN